jgi:hypothetical protein
MKRKMKQQEKGFARVNKHSMTKPSHTCIQITWWLSASIRSNHAPIDARPCAAKQQACPLASRSTHRGVCARAQARRARWGRRAHACVAGRARSIDIQPGLRRRRVPAAGRRASWKRMHVPCFSTSRASPYPSSSGSID